MCEPFPQSHLDSACSDTRMGLSGSGRVAVIREQVWNFFCSEGWLAQPFLGFALYRLCAQLPSTGWNDNLPKFTETGVHFSGIHLAFNRCGYLGFVLSFRDTDMGKTQCLPLHSSEKIGGDS